MRYFEKIVKTSINIYIIKLEIMFVLDRDVRSITCQKKSIKGTDRIKYVEGRILFETNWFGQSMAASCQTDYQTSLHQQSSGK